MSFLSMTIPWRGAQAPVAFAAVFAIAQLSSAAEVPVAFCLSKKLMGIPCPGCGITTSVEALLRGRWADAVAANAAGPFVVLFVAIQLVVALTAAANILSGVAVARWSRLNDRALATMLLTVWLIRLMQGDVNG